MPFNTAAVGYAVTPTVIQTFFSHYLNRKPLAQKPTAHISYDEGIHLIRQFLTFASHHTVEDLQRFTAQWVPHPSWVKVEEIKIPGEFLTQSADAIREQLGHHGIEKVGGKTWWEWRRPKSELSAEWIEMRSDYHERKRLGSKGGKRVMLYVHGGAYFFGSVDEHRYQMQRHARKLKARVFAPKYRLAPQFPFPCGLYDCLAAYLYLLTIQDPTTILLAGDSAGGGMVLSMLVTLRDRGLPLPAGAILISPWVDLTHSFPSVGADNPLDYIPPHGFHQRPSSSWPPPNSDDIMKIQEDRVHKLAHKDHLPQTSEEDAVQGFHVNDNPARGTANENANTGAVTSDGTGKNANTVAGPGHDLSIMIDGKLVEIKDQIQMYTTNQLLSHPLVSPVLQPSLGGLPPLLILVGGGEMLRDEQIYLAHKAANPAKYPPGEAFLDENPHDHNKDQVERWKPTDVQLQIWDDLCHVAPTLSFTRPAKYMYRSVAQFGAWALARAQKTEIEIMDDDDVSVISASESDVENGGSARKSTHEVGLIGKAGDPLPAFKGHMIRQRVDRHGIVRSMEPASELPACQMQREHVGVIKESPVRKWMKAKREWDTKYSSSKRKVQKQRAREMAEGYQTFGIGEVPPPSALAGRRKNGKADEAEKKKRSYGLSMWALMGSKHDETTIKREEIVDRPTTVVATAADGQGARALHDIEHDKPSDSKRPDISSRSRSAKTRRVKDEQQTEGNLSTASPTNGTAIQGSTNESSENGHDQASGGSSNVPAIPTIVADDDGIDTSKARPKANGIAFPFKLKRTMLEGDRPLSSASIATLHSTVDNVAPSNDVRVPSALSSGLVEVQDGTKDTTPGTEKALESSKVDESDKLSSTGLKGAESSKDGEGEKVVVQNGAVIDAKRPPLDTFVTAVESLPKV